MSVTTATLVTEPGAASCPENPASGPRVRNAPYSCDLQDIPKRILKTPRLVPVAHMDEVLRVALALIQKESADFLKEPSVAVDWRVPIERRGGGGNGDRRESIPVASAVPPPDEPVREVPSQPPALQTTVVPIDPESGSGGGGELGGRFRQGQGRLSRGATSAPKGCHQHHRCGDQRTADESHLRRASIR